MFSIQATFSGMQFDKRQEVLQSKALRNWHGLEFHNEKWNVFCVFRVIFHFKLFLVIAQKCEIVKNIESY